ncbi:MAG: hypothetical protein COW01_14820 [Bdellovibrionales bacterium CG12_big_fil_rev_8_21_14_0_65_38_15]|nr:MAG: hypothetical protein COW79_07735 [Bdellovibrionales bacterium CG22_combo_CG10-13_8_21_14_all_38_13]PIQ52956.1 MAG: hypothetical protein COW01_14820 [Bdellovibrionales bacterium CG12_big_fil_rev_8_21_14_0_65_38_15]PIR28684.1 MAG: hypothetical protein COV38_14580 [Bdellovibrionales bacterium CG11_big_fil_rev_8_21_14_0_20_38_13]
MIKYNLKKFKIFFVAVLLFFSSFIAMYKIQVLLLEQRLETLEQTINIQRKWHGLSLDNYSLGILIRSFAENQPSILPTKITVSDNVHTRYLKQFNKPESFVSNILNVELTLNKNNRLIFLAGSFSNAYILIWTFISLLISVSFFGFYLFLKKWLNNKQRLLISKQVAHDIQAPIAALNSILNSDRLSSEHLELVRGSINRIQDISADLNPSPKSVETKISIHNTLMQVETEFKARSLNLKVVQSKIDSLVFFDRELIRHLTNLLNNAFEASKYSQQVELRVEQSKSKLYLSIIDRGIGIPTDILQKLDSGVSVSFGKANGQGIGLYYAKKYFESKSGQFSIESTINQGTKINIELPISQKRSIIQLEDDYFVRKAWEIDAKSADIDLRSFNSWSSLKQNLDDINKESEFYLDINLNGELDGLQIAKKLHSMGYQNINLSTGDINVDISSLPFINGINDKTAPFDLKSQ